MNGGASYQFKWVYLSHLQDFRWRKGRQNVLQDLRGELRYQDRTHRRLDVWQRVPVRL